MLVQLTVQKIREMSGASPYNTFRMSARDSAETEIWAALNQHPLDSEQQRLLIITDAERLERLDCLDLWIKENQSTRNRNAAAVFVANEPELSDSIKEVIKASSSAQYVRCSLPKNDEDRLKRAEELICGWGNISRVNAGVLARRVGLDLTEARAVMVKASLFPKAVVTVPAIEMLATRHIEDEIVWSLIRCDKRSAAEALAEGSDQIAGGVIGTLASHVDVLARINTLLTSPNHTVKEVARRLSLREQWVRTLLPHARMYPRDEAQRRILLLTRLDNLYQRGAREGILESLVALW